MKRYKKKKEEIISEKDLYETESEENDETEESSGEESVSRRSSFGHIFVKFIITLIFIMSFALFAVACVKQFVIDKIPEQSGMLPTGFTTEITEKSPWDRFVDFLFGKGTSDDDENKLPDGSLPSGTVNSETNHGTSDENSITEDDSTTVKRKDEFYNFLLIAKDKGGGNTDTMMLLPYDVPGKKVSLLQIPRDTCVKYNKGIRKINSVYSIAYRNTKGNTQEKTEKGIEALSECLLQNFGIVIDRYVIVDLKGFRAIVDTIGGVDVYVQKDMVYEDEYQDLYINLKKGKNHLDGKKAEQFVRFRKGYVNADLGRMDAQKIFMSAFLKKLLSTASIKKAPELISHVMEYVDTNVSLQEATYFGTRLLDMNLSAITMHSLQGTSGSHTYYNGASYFSPYKNANIDLVNQYFNVFNKDLGPENVNPHMIVKESGSGKYEGGKTAEEIDENNPTLNYVY